MATAFKTSDEPLRKFRLPTQTGVPSQCSIEVGPISCTTPQFT
jgi:hypothetical protein